MAYSPSSIPSSILISMICAPPSTCSLAILSASSYFSSLIKRRNFLEPVTLVRSPIFTNTLSGVMINGSNPDNTRFLLVSACAIFIFICPSRLINQVGFALLSYYFGRDPKGSGYSLQVLALPSSSCGLSATIPHAILQLSF